MAVPVLTLALDSTADEGESDREEREEGDERGEGEAAAEGPAGRPKRVMFRADVVDNESQGKWRTDNEQWSPTGSMRVRARATAGTPRRLPHVGRPVAHRE